MKDAGYKVFSTRFAELGFINQEPGLWRFVDKQNPISTSPYGFATIGPQYATKAELLADLSRFATEYGCNGSIDPHNTFRAVDAFEYTDAYRNSLPLPAAEIRNRLTALSGRIAKVWQIGEHPHALLAAYRGYEDALEFIERQNIPGVVKIDDTDPTRCERLTPAGYV